MRGISRVVCEDVVTQFAVFELSLCKKLRRDAMMTRTQLLRLTFLNDVSFIGMAQGDSTTMNYCGAHWLLAIFSDGSTDSLQFD